MSNANANTSNLLPFVCVGNILRRTARLYGLWRMDNWKSHFVLQPSIENSCATGTGSVKCDNNIADRDHREQWLSLCGEDGPMPNAIMVVEQK